MTDTRCRVRRGPATRQLSAKPSASFVNAAGCTLWTWSYTPFAAGMAPPSWIGHTPTSMWRSSST
eukprot:4118617-Alexandrium_andersonii.AAC.1